MKDWVVTKVFFSKGIVGYTHNKGRVGWAQSRGEEQRH